MRALRELWRRVRYLGRRTRFNSELNGEIEFHIDCRAAELIDEGVAPEEARARARREFGSSRRAIEETREAWQLHWLEDLFSDLRYAGRAFRRNPAFACTAIICLALGIGANMTMFSITTAFLFNNPSCRDAGSMVGIWEGGNSNLSLADYRFIRDAHLFDGVAAIDPEDELNWRDGDRTRRVSAALVTGEYFQTLGVPFALGRGILPGETNTVVISHRFWSAHFASDPGIPGRRLLLDGRAYTITGVLPADHRIIVGFGMSPDIYAPATRDSDYLGMYARLPRGMTISVARAKLQAALAELDRIHPMTEGKRTQGTRVFRASGLGMLAGQKPGGVLIFFIMLMILVSLVLLIACTNVASLLLARASSRSQELAVRMSLGAGRSRIVRHLLAESLLLAVLGTAAGLLINTIAVNLVSGITLPLRVPIHLVMKTDTRLLTYSICIALACALIAGLLPAFRGARRDVNAVLRADERQVGRGWGLRGVFVSGQLAITVVLLAAGFLFLHNLLRAASFNPGFDVNHLVWASVRPVPERYMTADTHVALANAALERLRAVPGVEAASIAAHVPLNDNCRASTDVRIDTETRSSPIQYECNGVGPEYFRAMGIRLLAGREFTDRDRAGGERVGIVNESFARAVFGHSNPVGRTIYLHGKPLRIVGMMADSKYFSFNEDGRPALFEPWTADNASLNFMIRTHGAPAAFVKSIADVLGRLDSTAAIEIEPMTQAMGIALLPSRAGAAMLGTMGILGLALASIGLYGVLLYSVSRRTREIGLRVALGATSGRVLRLVCRDGLVLVGSGVAIGLALAFAAMRPMAMFLVPGLNPEDPSAFLAVVGVLGAVAVLATMAPAVRALRVDPMTALRYE
ncbi:MAG TPA: ABC transporter permease [Bryobacteraceae bacterium]|nr:ABC transporter permease [Bryobacteraceae bacterium]